MKHSQNGKKKERDQRKRRRISEEIISQEVEEEIEEEDGQDEDGQEYLFFDIESCQDDGQHMANLLIVQDQTGLEMVLKGMTSSTNSVHGCWMELMKVPSSLPTN